MNHSCRLPKKNLRSTCQHLPQACVESHLPLVIGLPKPSDSRLMVACPSSRFLVSGTSAMVDSDRFLGLPLGWAPYGDVVVDSLLKMGSCFFKSYCIQLLESVAFASEETTCSRSLKFVGAPESDPSRHVDSLKISARSTLTQESSVSIESEVSLR